MKKFILLFHLFVCPLLFSAPGDSISFRIAESAWRSKGAIYDSPDSFVSILFKNESITLPPIRKMRERFTHVPLSEARQGDILIFNNGGKESPAVYLGNNDFAYVVNGKADILRLTHSSIWWKQFTAVLRYDTAVKPAIAQKRDGGTSISKDKPGIDTETARTTEPSTPAHNETINETRNFSEFSAQDKSRYLVGDQKRDGILSTALDLIGTPYRYGGTSPRGFDCSGFVHYVYKQQGILLPRTSAGQFHSGRTLTTDDAQPGDLVFFTTRRGKTISHVAIYLGKGLFVHAPSRGKRVTISSLYSNKYWKYRYYGTCSVLDSNTVTLLSTKVQ